MKKDDERNLRNLRHKIKKTGGGIIAHKEKGKIKEEEKTKGREQERKLFIENIK